MGNEKQIINKEFKKLIMAYQKQDDNTRILIGNKNKKIIFEVSNYADYEKNLKDAGEMTMYDYDDKTKKITRMKQVEFFEKYCDNESSFGKLVWDNLKPMLATYNKDTGCGIYAFRSEETVYSYIKDKDSKTFIMFGLNCNEVFAQEFVDKEMSDYVKCEMKDEDGYFSLSSNQVSTEYCGIKKITDIYDLKEITNKCKELDEVCKNKNIKITGMANIQKALELYKSYKEQADKWNKVFEELRTGWKKISSNGTKMKKGYLRTPEEEKEEKRLTELLWSIEPIMYRDSDYSKFCNFAKWLDKQLTIAKNYDTLNAKGVEMLIEVPNTWQEAFLSVNGKPVM